MPCFLTQLQKKLQVDYKTNISQKSQKIDLCGGLTTKDLKTLHSSRWVGGTEIQRHTQRCRDTEGQSHTHVCWIKTRRNTSGVRYPNLRADHPAQGSSVIKSP